MLMVTPLLPGTLVAGALDLDVGVLLPPVAVPLPPLTRPGSDISILRPRHEGAWEIGLGLIAGVTIYLPFFQLVPRPVDV